MPTNADIWRERNGTVQRIAQGVASGYTPSDVQPDDRFYVLPPGERPVGPGAYGPLLDNLQFFADYENWSAGDPLPNRYPDNSGITSFADNNQVGAETASPLVGANSGDYTKSNNEYHSHPDDVSLQTGNKSFSIGCWVEFKTFPANNFGVMSKWGSSSEEYILIYDGNNFKFFVRNGIDVSVSVPFSSTGQKVLLTAYHDADINEIGIAVNDNAFSTKSYTGTPTTGTEDFWIANRKDSNNPLDGRLDNVHVNIGSLDWKNNTTWRYNAGAGRSWNEIKNYTP